MAIGKFHLQWQFHGKMARTPLNAAGGFFQQTRIENFKKGRTENQWHF
jgi:hypothetical protein